MVKAKVVTIEELKNNNPTLCLSPNRVFGTCHKCDVFKKALNKNKHDINKIIQSLKCVPNINKEIIDLNKEKQILLDKLNNINKRIDTIEG